MRALVVGYGNPLREDDGAGWYVAGRLSDRLGATARVLRLHQLTPELSADLAEVDLVVFVDARAEEPERGVEIVPVEPADAPAHSHYSTPGALLAMARLLFGRAPAAYLASIPAHSFGFSEALTAPTRSACDEAVARIAQLIRDLGSAPE